MKRTDGETREMLDISKRIDEIRKRVGVSQIVLAQAIGRSQSYLAKRILSNKVMSAEELAKMSIFLQREVTKNNGKRLKKEEIKTIQKWLQEAVTTLGGVVNNMCSPIGIVSRKTGSKFIDLSWLKSATRNIDFLDAREVGIAFVGKISCGKSTAVSWTVKHLIEMNPSAKIGILDVEDILLSADSKKNKYEAVITSLVQALSLDSLDMSHWNKGCLTKVLQDNLQKNPVILVLDDLDKFGAKTAQRVVMLMKSLIKETMYSKNHLAVVMACSQKSFLPDLNSDFHDYFDVVELEGKLSEIQVEELASEFGLSIIYQDKNNIERRLKNNILLVHNLFYWYAQYLRGDNPRQINLSEWMKDLPESSSSEENCKELEESEDLQSFLKVYQRYTARTKKNVRE